MADDEGCFGHDRHRRFLYYVLVLQMICAIISHGLYAAQSHDQEVKGPQDAKGYLAPLNWEVGISSVHLIFSSAEIVAVCIGFHAVGCNSKWQALLYFILSACLSTVLVFMFIAEKVEYDTITEKITSGHKCQVSGDDGTTAFTTTIDCGLVDLQGSMAMTFLSSGANGLGAILFAIYRCRYQTEPDSPSAGSSFSELEEKRKKEAALAATFGDPRLAGGAGPNPGSDLGPGASAGPTMTPGSPSSPDSINVRVDKGADFGTSSKVDTGADFGNPSSNVDTGADFGAGRDESKFGL
jgi:hypothetical protein